jgi:hypothetical protein
METAIMNYGQNILYIKEPHQELSGFVLRDDHVSTEDRNDVSRGRFCDQLEHVLNQFFKYYMKVYCSVKIGREGILNHTTGNEF